MKTTAHIEYHMYTWYYTTPKSSTACDFVCAVALRVRESAITACAQAVQCGHGGADRKLFTQRLTVDAEAVRGVAVCQKISLRRQQQAFSASQCSLSLLASFWKNMATR